MTLSKLFKAGAVAIALSATALAAVPAQAAPQFSFQFGVGNGFGFGFGGPQYFGQNGITLQFGDPNYYQYCLTDTQVKWALKNNGYAQVKIVKYYNSTNKVLAIGWKNGDWWQMRVDRCTGKVDHVQIIQQQNNGNFQLFLNF
jgi:hypothetical protein